MTTLFAQFVTALAKNVHGSRPARRRERVRSVSGHPTSRLNTSVKISIGATGWMIAHARRGPSACSAASHRAT